MNDLNPWQLERQLQYRVRSFLWPTAVGSGPARGSNEPLFKKQQVIVTPLPTALVLERMVPPLCLIRPAQTTGHRERPEIHTEAHFLLEVVTRNQTHFAGQGAAQGDLREDVGRSTARGADELLTQVFQQLAAVRGIQARPRNSSASQMETMQGSNVIVSRKLDVIARFVPVAAGYTPGSRFLVTKTSGGHFTLTWALPYDRYDLAQLKIVRKKGSTPTTPTDGTAVLTSTGTALTLPVTVTDVITVSETWTWGLWFGYDEGGISPPDYSYSPQLAGTGTG